MAINRRRFLGIAGLGTIGLAGGRIFGEKELLASGAREGGAPNAKRWAMVVDLPVVLEQEDPEAIIAACHKVHNVPDLGNEEEAVKWIWQEPYEETFPEQAHEYASDGLHEKDVLVFCNHCNRPPCTKVCPTQATWKRDDGIVMMDWHRCIGCRYCIAACPYGSRSFNWRDPRPHLESTDPTFPTRTRGVVEKCTFCPERLAKGQAPACVEACRHNGLVFGDLSDPNSRVRKLLRTRHAVRRKPGLGTEPEVFYLVDGFSTGGGDL